MSVFAAWHLPGFEAADLHCEIREFGSLAAQVPVLTAPQIARIAKNITEARDRVLLHTSTAQIVAAIDAAAARLSSPDTAEGAAARVLLPQATGYSREVVEDVLAHMTADWRSDSLHTLLLLELGDPQALDRFVARAGGFTRAIGPRFAAHIFSGNVPGVAVTSIVRSLLVKAATFGKTASGEPVLPVLFARALQTVSPDLAECLAVTYWRGGDEALEDALLAHADALVVYGGEEAVQSLRTRARAHTRVIEHGPRLSFGVVGGAADRSVAAAIAAATAAYDQQGCVSPHAVFVEQGGSIDARELARDVAKEMEALAGTMPRRRLSHAEALAIRQQRARTEFRGIAGSAAEVFGPDDTSFTVLYDDVPDFPISCLNRTLFIIPVDDVGRLGEVLEPHRERLQSAALAGFEGRGLDRICELLAGAGVSRITTFEQLPWPPMWWHHDGRGPLRELLSWVDREA